MENHLYKLPIKRDHILNPVESLLYSLASETALRSKEDMAEKYLNYIAQHKSECKMYSTSKWDINKAISNLVGMGYLREVQGSQITRAMSFNK